MLHATGLQFYKKYLSKAFLKDFAFTYSVGKTIEQLLWRTLFNQNTSSGCFYLCQQFPKKQKKWTY